MLCEFFFFCSFYVLMVVSNAPLELCVSHIIRRCYEYIVHIMYDVLEILFIKLLRYLKCFLSQRSYTWQ